MKIGIDISQTAYTKTGTSNYIKNLTEALLKIDKNNEYVLFFSSLRRELPYIAINPRTTIKKFRFPPSVLSLIWNKWHILPIENLIGDVDIFITSDWTEPPVKKAKKASIIYDLIVYRYPKETHNRTQFNPLKLIISPNIVASQRRKLKWVKKESDIVFCISESTKKDVSEILGIDKSKLKVAYPGI